MHYILTYYNTTIIGYVTLNTITVLNKYTQLVKESLGEILNASLLVTSIAFLDWRKAHFFLSGHSTLIFIAR